MNSVPSLYKKSYWSGFNHVDLIASYVQVMIVTVRVIQRDFQERRAVFQPRPYFRLFVTWLVDFNAADPILDSSNFQVHTKN